MYNLSGQEDTGDATLDRGLKHACREMDTFLAKIEELKREAERLKHTCRCVSTTPTGINKKTKRNIISYNNDNNGIIASPGGLFSNGITSSPCNIPGYKVIVFHYTVHTNRFKHIFSTDRGN